MPCWSRWAGAAWALAFACGLAMAPGPACAAESIRIGLVAELTGANVETGGFQVNGVRLALDEINQSGGVLGRPLELVVEDNQSTNPGSVAAFQRLMEHGSIVAVVTPVRSTQILAMMPAIEQRGVPALVGGTDVALTQAGNPWIFRARPHDGYSSRVLADFGAGTLGLKRWAIVHTTEAYGIGGKNQLTEALQRRGITPVVALGISATTQDFAPAIRALKDAAPDVIATYVANAPALGAFAQQVRAAGVSCAWLGSPTIASVPAIRQGGAALYGSYSVNDFALESGPEAAAYAARYQARFGLAADFWSAWAYDAVQLIARAIAQAHGTRPQALREALLATQGYAGVEGTYRFDARGDGLHGYNLIRNDGGKIVFLRRIEFDAR